jgi:type I restriction enzyme M protein
VFKENVDKAIKDLGLKLSAPEKNSILNAVSWYDETAEKVIKKFKLNGEKLLIY